MLNQTFERHGLSLEEVVVGALEYFRRCQMSDGSIAEDPDTIVFQEWDSVNALKSFALWPESIALADADGTVEGIRSFLRSREKATGMLSWGASDTGPAEYCTETSSEYVSALALLGHRDQAIRDDARHKAGFLRGRQQPSGAWNEVHSQIPKAFQEEPSVTGFALMALLELDLEPLDVDSALTFLAGRQKPEGHFGINWYYYATHYYLMRPAVAALAAFDNHAAIGAARDFTLSRQRSDGSWFSAVEGFSDACVPEQHTALALATLAHSGMTAADPAVRRAVGWLLDRRRPDGSWDGGHYPYPRTDSYRNFHATQDVFTTAQVLSAFRQLAVQEAG